MPSDIEIRVGVEGAADVELARETDRLCQELARVPGASVRLATGAPVPGTRGIDPFEIGAIIGQLVALAESVTSVLDILERWWSRNPGERTFRLTLDGDTLEGPFTREQRDHLYNLFMTKHSD